jgi:membrane protein insertase Oxa1/YidC/SpoIIIJ
MKLSFSQAPFQSEIAVKIEEKGMINNLFSHLFFAPVYNLFIFLLSFLPNHSLGLAIILLTIIIRLILLVPQHHMLMSTRKLQAIQPKIKEIQEKHAEDRSKLGMELMELYKKEKVNPFGSCLPLLIQMPILIVLYQVIYGVTTVADTYYLYGLFQSFNISVITTNFFGLNLLGVGGIA